MLVCPDNIKNSPDDYVAWSVIKSGKAYPDTGICYNQIMTDLGNICLELTPRQKPEFRTSPEIFTEWMGLCKQEKLIPPDVKITTDEGQNKLYIPSGFDKHWTYAALCCYRFSDCFARMVWFVMENMKQSSSHITFWQALHYAMAMEYTYGSGHSFSYVSKDGAGVYDSCDYKTNIASSVGLSLFFQKPMADRAKVASRTNDAVKAESEKLGDWKWEGNKKKAVLLVSPLEELLADKWTPLYKISNPTKEKMLEAYKSVA